MNETNRLIPFRQAVFWRYFPSGDIKIEAVSSVAQLDTNAPYIVWLQRLIKHRCREDGARKIEAIDAKFFPEKLAKEWAEWLPSYILWCPLITPQGDLLGGLWLTREKPWERSELGLSEWLSDAYSHSLQALLKRTKVKVPFYKKPIRRKIAYGFVAAVCITMLFPIDQSALAPAEVVAKKPTIASSPINGVVETFSVEPNQVIKEGDLLFGLDETEIKNQYNIALKSLAVARAEFRKATQKAFTDAESRAQAAILKAQVSLRETEVSYAAELLERINIKADTDGIAIFEDPNQWIGRPVVVGEKIITIADPNQVELELMLAVDDAINLEEGADIRVFFNVDPLNPYNASLKYASYEAEPTPDNILAYRLKAKFTEDTKDIRIGLKGTAKIYGEKVTIFYYLFRRPLSAVRRFLGI